MKKDESEGREAEEGTDNRRKGELSTQGTTVRLTVSDMKGRMKPNRRGHERRTQKRGKSEWSVVLLRGFLSLALGDRGEETVRREATISQMRVVGQRRGEERKETARGKEREERKTKDKDKVKRAAGKLY